MYLKKPDINLITYGGNISIAVEASERAFIEEEIVVNILVPYSFRPIEINWIMERIGNCGKL